MYNLVVYGSLLNTKELAKHNIGLNQIQTIKVKGYKRVFNQLPSWRKVDGIRKAVMNVFEDENSWLNAIVIKNLTSEYIRDLDEREIGYDRVSITDGNVVTYSNIILKNCIIYKGKVGKQSNNILPNPKYFKICKDGAKEHGEEFFQDYLLTTFINDLNGGIKRI